MDDASRLVQTITEARNGNAQAAAELLPLLYGDLRKLANDLMRRQPPGLSCQATALVHEAYERLVGVADPGWDGRAHFFGAAARAMREILVDQARRRNAQKRGGERKRQELHPDLSALHRPVEDFLALNEALDKLEAEDPRKLQIVSMRFFCGLNMEEIAEALDVSKSSVERDWRFARAWLYRELDSQPSAAQSSDE